MPYIKKDERIQLEGEVGHLSSGQLNFLFAQLINTYLSTNKISYASFNDVLGALEGAKLEFYRRIVVPYEEKKKEENGDVY